MKKVFVASLLGCLLFLGAVMNGTAQEEDLSDMTPEELFEFRENYLENFDRIGLNTAYSDAKFLRIIVESTEAKRGVEVGSCNGYGAMFMGMGFERNDGKLYTIEILPRYVKQCRENIKTMGLQESVECIEGDALKVMPKLEGKFDFMFIDAVKSDYYKYFKIMEPKLEKGAVIVADNVIQFENEMKDFFDVMRKSPDYDMVIFQTTQEKRDGMAIIYKKK